MTSKQKLGALQHSINQAEMGLTKIVRCPYCETDLDFSPPGLLTEDWQPPTCCADFALSALAIMQRKAQAELKDIADRIQQNAGGLPVFN